MKNDAYWKRRQVQDAFNVFQKAEETADQISKLYLKASRYLSLEADEVFEKYQTKYWLSETEARRLINTIQDGASLEILLQKLRNGGGDESKKKLLMQLEAPAYQARIEHFRQLQNQLDLIMRNVYQYEKDFNTSFYTDLANETYYRSIYKLQQRADAAFSFSHLSAKTIDKVVNSRWSGKNYSERIWDNTHALAGTLKEELLINLVTGRTNRDAAQIIANKFAQGASNSRRLVRTESNYVSTEMNFHAYKECGIEKYQYLATLDLRTSIICRKLDGKIFLVSSRKIGENCPPMHPWCRSTTISVVDRSLIDKMQRSAVNPSTGKRIKVPRFMSYWEWHDKYVKGKPAMELMEKKIKNHSSDRTQYKKYKKVLGKDIPETLDDFQNLKYNEGNRWDELKNEFRTVNRYEVVSGNLKPSDIVRLDKKLSDEKLHFNSRFRSQGNIAVAEFYGKTYIAHSKVKNEFSKGYVNYTGKSEFVLESQDRVFRTKRLPDEHGWDRKVDSEAKLFEYINSAYIDNKVNSTLNMVSNYLMCESCLGVMEQFKALHPEIRVNIIQKKVMESGEH